MLRIALPKGRMSEDCVALLYEQSLTSFKEFSNDRLLNYPDLKYDVEYLLVRSKDVGTYVERGAADCGVTGLDLLREHEYKVYTPGLLPFGHCRLSVAYPDGKSEWKKRKNIRVATKYPRLAADYFYHAGYNTTMIELYGSIEIAPVTGISDVIVDLISTGKTLKENHLVEDETIMQSQAVFIVNPGNLEYKRFRIVSLTDSLTSFSLTP